MPDGLLLPLALIVGGAALLVWHVTSWRGRFRHEPDSAERAFRWRQLRRRMQISGMLLLVGALMAAVAWIDRREQPSLFVYCWVTIVMLNVWMLVLAAADIAHIRLHARQTARRQLLAPRHNGQP